MQGSPRIDELRQKFHENPRRYFAPLANEYRKAGDPEQAIAICRAHLAQQPGHMSGHVVYAQSLYDAGRVDESRVVFEKALSLDPDNAIVLRYLGEISRQRGDSAEALHWYSRALDADPHDSEIAAYVAELTEPLTEQASPEQPQATSQTPNATNHSAESGEPAAEAGQPIDEPVAAAKAETTVEEHKTEPDSEVVLPEPAKEPEVVAAAESPFVTRTMAELYASQGHRDAALDVYRQLAAQNPNDNEIAGRIEELSESDAHEAPEPVEASEPAAVDEIAHEAPADESTEPAHARDQQIPTMEPVEFADFAPEESELAATEPETSNEFGELTDFDADLTFRAETEERSSEKTPSESTSHFTETEIGDSAAWDAQSWGKDLESEDVEITPFDFAQSDSSTEYHADTEGESTDARSILEPHAAAVPEPAHEEPAHEEPAHEEPAHEEPAHEEPAHEEPAHEEPAAQPGESVQSLEIDEYGAAPLPLGVLNDARDEFTADELAASTHGDSSVSEPPHDEERDDDTLVAYSPQTPDEEELPHYVPEGPTIREFFATLGARRPPENGDVKSFTAHAAVPSVEPIDDLPLASDAFSSLFADSTVSEDDSRAAFALSGAMSAQSQTPQVSAPRATPQSAAPPVNPPAPTAAPAAAQESEEDIRRFREWLDGLADA